MKRAISIFLILCLSAPIWLNYSFFLLSRLSIRQEVKEKIKTGLEASEVVVLRLAHTEVKTALDWEHEKEFRYKGQFYDILKIEVLPDSVVYTCYWDKDETFVSEYFEGALLDEFREESDKNGTASHLMGLIKTPYRPAGFSWHPAATAVVNSNKINWSCIYQSVPASIPSPPPKRA